MDAPGQPCERNRGTLAARHAGIRSEDQLQPEFEHAARTGSGHGPVRPRGLARGVETRRRIDPRERWMIDAVKRSRPELQPPASRDFKFLDGGDTPLPKPRADKNIAPAVSENSLHHAL